MENAITYNPIGIIHTPFKEIEGMPVQPASANKAQGKIELNNELF
jgi:tRNA (Thr-GGU) A37 N-methylase